MCGQEIPFELFLAKSKVPERCPGKALTDETSSIMKVKLLQCAYYQTPVKMSQDCCDEAGCEMKHSLLILNNMMSMDDRPRESQCPELQDHGYENYQLPVDPEDMWDLLLQLDPYKSMGPDGVHPRILKLLLMASQNIS
ncbi:hypothetical protein BTVI_52818 [Pitangus sulphuratus]|nr:hypothetical protein BTVI_52818 [Pitangus sulphuratus]